MKTPQEIMDDLEREWGEPKGYCRFCNTKNCVVKNQCELCGAGSYLMPEVEL